MNIIPYDKNESTLLEYYACSSIGSTTTNNDNTRFYAPPPLPSLNGGLYTGEKFKENSGYRNFPNKPDSVYLHTKTLSSANPPPGAQYQFPDSFRPGNNVPDTHGLGLHKYGNEHSIMCTKASSNHNRENDISTTSSKNKGFRKYHYL